ncbi:hypothetical protein C8Q78DRAFT_44866 [Trametes maxima]|nr:hypothetical protein C8Q78DRAFT_44866 [Trametes maxima]
MAAASNPWAAVADAVNSLSLADKAIVLVSSSLSAMGALGAARLVSRGPGGYNAQITDLERILKIWEDFLDPRNLTEAYAAQIDATAGPGSVAIMRERLRIVKFAFATLRADVGKASFWQKCSWGNNELQASMTQVNSAIRWADEDFQRTTENTRRAVILSLAREARDAQQPEGQASGSPPPTTSPPPAQDPALATYPPGAHSQPSLQG